MSLIKQNKHKRKIRNIKFNTSRAKSKKKTNWMFNLGKSLLKALPETFTDELPETKDAISGINEKFLEGGNIGDTLGVFKTATNYLKTRAWDQGIKVASKNAWDRIKTGDFYGKDDENDFGGYDEFNFDDDSLDFKDNDNNEDFGFDNTVSSSKKESLETSSENFEIKNITSGSIKDAKAIAQAEQTSSLKISSGISLMLGKNILSMLNLVHSDLKIFHEFNTNITMNFFKATNTYQAAMLTAQENQIEILRSIEQKLEDSNEFTGVNTQRTKKKDSEYSHTEKTLKERIMGTLEEFIGEDSFFGEAMKAWSSNPVKQLMKAGLKKLILNNKAKKRLGQLDIILSDLPTALREQFSEWEISNNFLKKGFFKLIDSRAKKGNLNTSIIEPKKRLEKGPIPFDGDTKTAIVEVIPRLLSKIHLATIGIFDNTKKSNKDILDEGNELTYDYNKGQFSKVKKVRETIQKEIREKNRESLESSNESIENFLELIKIQRGYDNLVDEKKKSFNETLNNFLMEMAQNPKFLNILGDSSKNGITARKNLEKIFLSKYGKDTDIDTLRAIIESIVQLNPTDMLGIKAGIHKSNIEMNKKGGFIESLSYDRRMAHYGEDTGEYDPRQKFEDFNLFINEALDEKERNIFFENLREKYDKAISKISDKNLKRDYISALKENPLTKNLKAKEYNELFEKNKERIRKEQEEKVLSEIIKGLSEYSDFEAFNKLNGNLLTPDHRKLLFQQFKSIRKNRNKIRDELYKEYGSSEFKDKSAILKDRKELDEDIANGNIIVSLLSRFVKVGEQAITGIQGNDLKGKNRKKGDNSYYTLSETIDESLDNFKDWISNLFEKNKVLQNVKSKVEENPKVKKKIKKIQQNQENLKKEKEIAESQLKDWEIKNPYIISSTDEGTLDNTSPSGFKRGGKIKFSTGGKVKGKKALPGKEDNLNVQLTNGEFVINKKATKILEKTFGKDFLHKLNSAKSITGLKEFIYSKFGKLIDNEEDKGELDTTSEKKIFFLNIKDKIKKNLIK